MNVTKRIRLAIYLLLVAVSFLLPFSGTEANQGAEKAERYAYVLNAEGGITPALRSYIERGIEQAEREGAVVLVIRLDTPGGSVEITQKIIQAMRAARVPIVVYVAPRGAHAASAGTFITLAGHVAAMAPGTSIGAASPVGPSGETLTDTMKSKVTNILVSDIEGLARKRGEKAVEWARRAVTEAEAATAERALELGVIDYVAPNLETLLTEMDGREVEVVGQTVVLRSKGAIPHEIPMSAIENFLHVITNPNIAFILLTIGINGLLFELANPGGYVAGLVGAICLVLALYAFGTLPVNYTGFIFIVLAFILFVADIKTPTVGLLTAAGVASFILGAFLLFSSPLYAVSRGVIVTVALCTGAFFAFVVTKAVAAQTRQPVTGYESLMGAMAEARTDLTPEGMVFLKGELWSARAVETPIKKGERVRVIGKEGFKLNVRKEE